MPKIKTSQAISKRFRVTKTKKFLRRKAGKSHLLAKKSQDRKKRLGKRACVSLKDIDNMINKLPYL